jgi:putative transposase
MPDRENLPRLARESYLGFAAVHWTLCIEDRATGWLSPEFHAHFREVLVHTAHRHGCWTPAYCLMPDHLHVLLLGIRPDADLYLAARFLHQHTAPGLRPFQYQKQAFDHVLREQERERGAFASICHYIAENPVRAGLCSRAANYEFSGCVVPGYPDLDLHGAGFWELFWRLHGHALTSAAT